MLCVFLSELFSVPRFNKHYYKSLNSHACPALWIVITLYTFKYVFMAVSNGYYYCFLLSSQKNWKCRPLSF